MKRLLLLVFLCAFPSFASGWVGSNGLTGFASINSFTATRTLAAGTNQVEVYIQSHTPGWTCSGMTAGSSINNANAIEYHFYLLNPGTTSFSSNCSSPNAASNTTYDVDEFNGFPAYDAGSGCNSGSSGSTSVQITTATSGEFVIADINDGSGSTLSSPLTQISSQSYVTDGYATASGSGTQTYTGSTASGGWAMCADAFKTGGGSSPAPTSLNTMGGIGD